MSLVDDTNGLAYSENYKLYDILWSDGKATQEVRPVSDGVVPIGLCLIPTGWLDKGEKARFVSLKYMNSVTPESGGLEKEYLHWGHPCDSPEQDPLKEYYIHYVCKDENNGEGKLSRYYYWSGNKDFKDLRERDNWLYALNYCKQNPGKYAIGDINGKQNTINISIEGNYYETNYKDMKPQVAKYAPIGTQAGDWYIPAVGELIQFMFKLKSEHNSPSINDRLTEIAKVYPKECVLNFEDGTYWASTVFDEMDAFYFKIDSVSIYINIFGRYDSMQVVAYLLK